MRSGTKKQQLKNHAQAIVLSQGNDFIKELLRQYQLKIGATMSEFLVNLNAIDKNLLSNDQLDPWLDEVEGWGKQHVYFHEPPAGSRQDIFAKVKGSQWKKLLNKSSSYSFPASTSRTSPSSCAGACNRSHCSYGKDGQARQMD